MILSLVKKQREKGREKGRGTVFHEIGSIRNHNETNAKFSASEDLITIAVISKNFSLRSDQISFTTIPTKLHASDTPFG